MLVRPKDRISDNEKPEVVYKIPCKNCKRVYVGETERPLAARVEEHSKEADSITWMFNRAGHTVLDGDPAPPPQERAHSPPPFSAHV